MSGRSENAEVGNGLGAGRASGGEGLVAHIYLSTGSYPYTGKTLASEPVVLGCAVTDVKR